MDADEVVARLTEYKERLGEYIKLRAIRVVPRAPDLNARQSKVLEWLIANQNIVGRIVLKLMPEARFRQMGGARFPSAIPTEQQQLISMALANLDADPNLADPSNAEESPWVETARLLDASADSMPQVDWTAQATEAQQLVAYVNPGAAEQISGLVEKHDFFGAADSPGTREKVVGVIRGAATAARLHGPHETKSGPQTVVTVEQSQHQEQAAVSVVSIEEVLTWDDLPDELRPDLEAIREARDAGDKSGLMKRASAFAKKAETFPSLVAKLGDAWEWVSGLIP